MSSVRECVVLYLQQSNMQNWWFTANMILPIKHNANKISKQLFDEQDDASSDNICSDGSDDDRICDCTSDGDSEEEKEQSTEMELKVTWLGLSPPVEESSTMGKWYPRIFEMKKESKLFLARWKWKHWSYMNEISETQSGNRDNIGRYPQPSYWYWQGATNHISFKYDIVHGVSK